MLWLSTQRHTDKDDTYVAAGYQVLKDVISTRKLKALLPSLLSDFILPITCSLLWCTYVHWQAIDNTREVRSNMKYLYMNYHFLWNPLSLSWASCRGRHPCINLVVSHCKVRKFIPWQAREKRVVSSGYSKHMLFFLIKILQRTLLEVR